MPHNQSPLTVHAAYDNKLSQAEEQRPSPFDSAAHTATYKTTHTKGLAGPMS